MPIPKEILEVIRPKNTVVKKRGVKFVVIKRTSKREGKRVIPVELGVVGEIVNGKFIERTTTPPKKQIDIKSYGAVALCDKEGDPLYQDLANIWDLDDAKRIYVLALLRAAFANVKNRDLSIQYKTSFLSEMYPGVHLSEQAVSACLIEIGQGYSLIRKFMKNRVEQFSGKTLVIDGMLKDFNSKNSTMSEFSRKGRTKGSKDMNLLYAFDPESKEPVAAKVYPGNMLDQTALKSFVHENNIRKGLLIFDKGFWNKEVLNEIDNNESLGYLIPLKKDSAFIKNYGMDNPCEVLKDYTDATILYKKAKMKNGNYLYSFRDTRDAYEQETGYVEQGKKKDNFDPKKYLEKRPGFGLIVFKSKVDLDPLLIYEGYDQRWDIEVMFNMYQNIMDRDTVNVHDDYRVIATEFINFLSTIIYSRVKNLFRSTGLSKKYSCKQIFLYLAKYQKVRLTENGEWETCAMLKYIQEIVEILGV